MANRKIPLIKAVKTPEKDVKLDPNGFFVIELDKKDEQIRVEYYSNVYKGKKIVSGILKKVFVGKKTDALCDIISKNVPRLLPEHYMYLGREIQRAQCALEKNKKYIQGGC
jgi:flagellar basal body rod protein FlgF